MGDGKDTERNPQNTPRTLNLINDILYFQMKMLNSIEVRHNLTDKG